MFKTNLIESGDGLARRILLIALSSLLVIATLTIIPGDAYGDEEPSVTTTSDPLATDTTVSDTTVPDTTIPETSTTTVAADRAPATETTTTTSTVVKEEPVPVETTTTTSTVVKEEPVPVETTTTTSTVVKEEPTVDESLSDTSTTTVVEEYFSDSYSDPAPPAASLLVASLPNPTLAETCGLNIAMVFDKSGSINSREARQFKDAAKLFVDALQGTPSQIGLTSFAGIEARGGAGIGILEGQMTSIATQAQADGVKASIDAIDFRGLAPGAPRYYTNWEDGFKKVNLLSPAPDLILYMTDGDPNTFDYDPSPGGRRDPRDLGNGVTQANVWKNSGVRIAAVGIGMSKSNSIANLKAISGPTENEDYFITDFRTMGEEFARLAIATCASTVTVTKYVDTTGNATDKSGYVLSNGVPDWEFDADATPSSGTVTWHSPTKDFVGNDGQILFDWTLDAPDATTDISIVETTKPNWTFHNELTSCTLKTIENTVATPIPATQIADGFSLADIPRDGLVECSVYNQEIKHSIDIEKGTSALVGGPFVDADLPTGPEIETGEPVYWQYVVTNPGNQPLHNVVVKDETVLPTPGTQVVITGPASGDTNNDGVLDAGETWIYTHDGNVVEFQYKNTAQVSATSEDGSQRVIDSDSSHYFGLTPSIHIFKDVGADADHGPWFAADTPTGPEYEVGASVFWEYIVTNTGGTPLTNIGVVDNKGLVPNCGGQTTLAVNESMVCTATSTVTLGQYTNIGLTEGYSPANTRVEDTDPANYLGLAHPQLILHKQVFNDNGGDALAETWTLTAAGSSGGFSESATRIDDQNAKVGPKDVTSGVEYTLSESGPDGYAASDWSCSTDGAPGVIGDKITLEAGQTVDCTIINNDIAPELRLFKLVVNNSGGTNIARDFFLKAEGTSGSFSGNPTDDGLSGSVGPNPVTAGVTYALSETGPAGYAAVQTSDPGDPVTSWLCTVTTAGGTHRDPVAADEITLAPGETAVCEIVNGDISPTLTLRKTVTNDDGGLLTQADFPAFINGVATPWDATRRLIANTPITVSETEQAGYGAGDWGGDCAADGSVTLALGQVAVCTITNDDAAPTLKLVKNVINDAGGGKGAGDWTLTAAAVNPTPPADSTRDYSELGDHATFETMFANTDYVLAETTVAGYTAGAWSCDGGTLTGTTLVLDPGQTEVTCEITNNDDAPQLTLTKGVKNEFGGTAEAKDWTLTATPADGSTPISGNPVNSPTDPLLGSYGPNDAKTGIEYALTESGSGDYVMEFGHFACVVNGADAVVSNEITLVFGDVAECTVINKDLPAQLELVKEVTNNDGGTAPASTWELHADGSSRGFSGTPTPADGDTGSVGPEFVDADVIYTLSESGGVGGYVREGDWSCVTTVADPTTGLPVVGDPVVGHTITLDHGDGAVCTVKNNDVAPTLKLVKNVINDAGGGKGAGDWTLTAAAVNPTPPADSTRDYSELGDHATFETMFANTDYVLAETTVAGYTAGAWSCDGGTLTGTTLVLDPGQTEVTCEITNNNDAPQLNLLKEVTNDHGGTAVPADWTLKATSTGTDGDFALPADHVIAPLLGATGAQNVFANNEYTLSETGTTGHTDDYTQDGPWSCVVTDVAGVKAPAVEGDTITLTEGESAECVVVNDDDTAELTLVKHVVNDNGGTSVAADWTLKATSTSGFGDISALADQNTSADDLTGDTGTQEVHANNEYTLSEMGTTAYSQVGMWSCVITDVTGSPGSPVLSNTITLDHGEKATCTATNDDDAPSLILVKDVVNDNGGDAVASAWDLIIDEGAADEKSVPGSVAGLEVTDQAGTYDLSETDIAGYTNTLITCDNLPDGVPPGAPVTTVTIELGETVTCTFTNDDDPASLLLQKTVVNDNGGNGVAADWTLSAGSNDVTGSATPVEATDQAGTYALSESVEPGYSQTSLTCDNVEGEVTEVTIALGETVTCVFVNDDLVVGVDIEKSTNGHDADTPTGPYVPVGDAVEWEYEITNPGLIPLSNVVVTDDQAGVTPVYDSGDTNTDDLLDPGETWVYKASGVAVAGQYANIGTVTAVVGGDAVLFGVVDAGIGDTITDTDPSHYFGVMSVINIEKSTNGEDADTPTGPEILLGDPVMWEYVVTNTGNTPLANVVVTDDQGVTPVFVSGDTNGDDLLDPTETWIYQATGVSVLGQYANIGTATGVDVTGATVTATDPSHYLGFGLASLGDTVWNDANSNGIQDNGEKGIAGAVVKLTLPDGTTLNTTTDADGKYLFTDLIPGTYTVELVMSSIPQPDEGELKLTTAGSFTVILAAGDNDLDSDFGVVAVLPVTGIDTTSIALIALALLLAGGLVVFLTTRKRKNEGDLAA